MSGIIGKLSFDPEETLARAVVDRMLDASRSRTEERRAVFSAPGIALGASGVQDEGTPAAPVATNERETVRVVADASLTNADPLRHELRRRGHDVQGGSDAELIAHAYEEWGPRCVEQLRGPFACAIWDGPARRLFLARDHVGIRSLYFALLPDHGLVFASELGALLRDPGVSRECSPEAIDAYLALGYVPAPLTAFRRISKLEPAHLMVVDGRRFHLEPFWDLPAADPHTIPEERAAMLDASLRAAIRDGVTARRETAILYSGATPSTTLLAAAPQGLGPAITVSPWRDAPELARCADAARHLGHRSAIAIAAPDVPQLTADLAACLEEPIADPAAVAQFAVCRAARDHAAAAIAAHGAGLLWGETAGHPRARVWSDEQRRAVYTRGFACDVRDAAPDRPDLERLAARPDDTPLERALYADAHTWLPDGVLAPLERVAGAAGLPLQLPFLDREIVELAAATPGAIGGLGRGGLQPLRRILLRRLPRALMPPARRRPHRLSWVRPALGALVPSVLLSPRFDGRGILSRPALAHVWEEHRDGRHDHTHRLWSLLMLELWFREFIDGDAEAGPLEYAARRAA